VFNASFQGRSIMLVTHLEYVCKHSIVSKICTEICGRSCTYDNDSYINLITKMSHDNLQYVSDHNVRL